MDPVLLLGIPSEPPLAMTAAALDRLGAPYLVLDQRNCAQTQVCVAVTDGAVTGALEHGGELVELEVFGGVYTRLMDHTLLPELRDVPPDDPRRRHADRLHEALETWYEIMPGRVVNRSAPMSTNASKPYQSQLIARHLPVPATLVTTVPDEVDAFRSEHRRVVYKSISGSRSVVHELADSDLHRLDLLRWCPVQFQEYIDGVDIRVHTLADGQVFATAVTSEAIDYRYAAHHNAGEATLAPHPIPDDLATTCLELAADLALDFAGIDLRITPDGQVYCFEVNPSPAYSYYEIGAGQPISTALAHYLTGTGQD